MLHADEVVGRAAIAEHVWDSPYEPMSNVIDVLIQRLRRKIDVPGQPSLIVTRRGEGYMLTRRQRCDRRKDSPQEMQRNSLCGSLPSVRSVTVRQRQIAAKTLPVGPVDSRINVPPWASAIHRAIGRPEPGAAVVGLVAREAFEDALALRLGNPAPIVRHTNLGVAPDTCSDTRTVPPRAGVADRVVDQVADHLAQQAVVADEADFPVAWRFRS